MFLTSPFIEQTFTYLTAICTISGAKRRSIMNVKRIYLPEPHLHRSYAQHQPWLVGAFTVMRESGDERAGNWGNPVHRS